jgi:hypothetical protein
MMPDVPQPPASPTQDNTTHNTSPNDPATPQKMAPVKIPKTGREVTGTIRAHKLPDAVYKHPNPVGRPRNPRP